MFGTQILRLLRTVWTNPNMLAQEIYAILGQPDLPLDHSGPLTLTKGAGSAPAVTFQGFGPGDVVLQIDRPNAPPIQLTGSSLNLGGIPLVNQGQPPIDLGSTHLDGSFQGGAYNVVPPETMGRGGTPDLVKDGAQAQALGLGQAGGPGGGGGAPSAMPGQVLSGSGRHYQVNSYPHGLDLAALPVPARVPQLADGQNVPAGTWVTLLVVDGLYYFQPPVWLDDLSP